MNHDENYYRKKKVNFYRDARHFLPCPYDHFSHPHAYHDYREFHGNLLGDKSKPRVDLFLISFIDARILLNDPSNCTKARAHTMILAPYVHRDFHVSSLMFRVQPAHVYIGASDKFRWAIWHIDCIQA